MNLLEHGPVPEFQRPTRSGISLWGLGAALSVCSFVLLGPWTSSAVAGPNRLDAPSRELTQHTIAIMLEEGLPDAAGPGLGKARAATGIGRNQPLGGSPGTGTIDPHLLDLPLVPPTLSLPSGTMNAEVPDRALGIAGDPKLPLAPGGDGMPAGRGNGYGWGTGNSLGSAGRRGGGGKANSISTEWGVLKKVPATYPYQARLRRIEGYVVVKVTVDAQGHPIEVLPVSGSGLLMSECLRVVKLWQFEPPGKYGLPAPATFPLTFLFRMDEPVATG